MKVGVLGGVGWSTLHPGRFPPRKDPVPCVEEAGWALGLVQMATKKSHPHWDLNSRPFSV